MKWPLKPWMAPRQTRLSRNSPLRLVGWAGRQRRLLRVGACVAVQKGQRLLDARRELSGRLRQVNLLHLPIDSPTEESTLIRPENPRQSVCFYPLLLFSNWACCTPQAPRVDSNYTAWHDDHSVGLWPGIFFCEKTVVSIILYFLPYNCLFVFSQTQKTLNCVPKMHCNCIKKVNCQWLCFSEMLQQMYIYLTVSVCCLV